MDLQKKKIRVEEKIFILTWLSAAGVIAATEIRRRRYSSILTSISVAALNPVTEQGEDSHPYFCQR